MTSRFMAVGIAGFLFAGSSASAQAQATQATQATRGQQRDSAGVQRRATLERQVRQRIAVMVKQRLQLSAAQAQQLQESEGRFELRRRDLMQREQGLRRDLRQQLSPGVAADQPRVASLLDQIMAVHRDRVTMTEQEQRDLARFLTPIQRAKYLGLQGELRKRIEGMRQGGRGGRAGAVQRPSGRRLPRQP